MTPHPLRALAVLAVFLLAPPAVAAKDKPIFELTDPRGDDRGAGNLVYPDNPDYAPGDLDLLALSARRGGDGTWFVATFARAVRQPERRPIDAIGTQLDAVAKNGFYTFNIDIYVDVDRKPGSGDQRTLPGRRAEVAPDFAWDRAVVLTPRPFYAKSELKRSMMRALRQELKKGDSELSDEEADARLLAVPADLEQHVFFPTQTRVRGREIAFFVPDDFLGGPPSADWGYVVMVSAADLQQSLGLASKVGLGAPPEERLLILPVTFGRPRESLGGGREGDWLQPPIVDLIAPAGTTQEKLLADYSRHDHRPVRLPGVVPDPTGRPKTVPSRAVVP